MSRRRRLLILALFYAIAIGQIIYAIYIVYNTYVSEPRLNGVWIELGAAAHCGRCILECYYPSGTGGLDLVYYVNGSRVVASPGWLSGCAPLLVCACNGSIVGFAVRTR